MKESFREIHLDDINSYCAINIEIPDEDLVNEMVAKFYSRKNKALKDHKTKDIQRSFLEKELHVARTKEEAQGVFTRAREKGDAHCIVISFNAALSQKKYDHLGVVNFKYLCWTKKAWEKAKKAYGCPIVKKLIDCLIDELINVSCQALKAALGIFNS